MLIKIKFFLSLLLICNALVGQQKSNTTINIKNNKGDIVQKKTVIINKGNKKLPAEIIPCPVSIINPRNNFFDKQLKKDSLTFHQWIQNKGDLKATNIKSKIFWISKNTNLVKFSTVSEIFNDNLSIEGHQCNEMIFPLSQKDVLKITDSIYLCTQIIYSDLTKKEKKFESILYFPEISIDTKPFYPNKKEYNEIKKILIEGKLW